MERISGLVGFFRLLVSHLSHSHRHRIDDGVEFIAAEDGVSAFFHPAIFTH
jgi:hypothetical protein